MLDSGEMNEKLTFGYDQVGDILYIDTCSPYAKQETEEIGDEIIARLNSSSGAIETLESLLFSIRLNFSLLLELLVQAL